MKKRVYGAMSIKSKMANFNADFTGNPKTFSKGNIFASDKACKYPMKKLWNNDEKEKVLYIRSHNLIEKKEKKTQEKIKKFVPKTLSERYKELFNSEVEKNSDVVIKNLFSCIDVMNFGATFAEDKQNLSITGAVQFNQGINKYDKTRIVTQDILSPFKDSTSEDAQMTSIGKKIVTDEAHYMYGFSVNPLAYKEYEFIEGFDGYTKEAYEKFKKAALISSTALNTNSKFGCENEFAIFIELKDEKELYLPDISNYIEYKKNEKDTFDLNKLEFLKSFKEDIELIEIYHNEYLSELIYDKINDLTIKIYNIYTKKEVGK